jgi:preprotein translocase subunit SecG
MNLLSGNTEAPIGNDHALFSVYKTLSLILVILMAVAALAAIILVLLQLSNSTGIYALGGSSETFFGKNKGKSVEAKMKKWTWICLAIILVLSVAFFILPVFFGA